MLTQFNTRLHCSCFLSLFLMLDFWIAWFHQNHGCERLGLQSPGDPFLAYFAVTHFTGFLRAVSPIPFFKPRRTPDIMQPSKFMSQLLASCVALSRVHLTGGAEVPIHHILWKKKWLMADEMMNTCMYMYLSLYRIWCTNRWNATMGLGAFLAKLVMGILRLQLQLLFLSLLHKKK